MIQCTIVGYRIKKFIQGETTSWHVFMIERHKERWRLAKYVETKIGEFKTMKEAEAFISSPTGYYESNYLYSKDGKFTPISWA